MALECVGVAVKLINSQGGHFVFIWGFILLWDKLYVAICDNS